MKLKAAQILIAALLLIPLSSIAQQLSYGTLADRAAFALNTRPDKVRIFDRQVDSYDILTINFMAERDSDGEKFKCSIVTVPGGVSNAMCTNTDGTMKGVRCDPRSKAAGRCR